MGLAHISAVSSRDFMTKSEPLTHGSSLLHQHPLPRPDYTDSSSQEMIGAVTSIDMKRLLSKPALPQATPYHLSGSEHSLAISSKSLAAASSPDLTEARETKGLGRAAAPKPVMQVRKKPSLFVFYRLRTQRVDRHLLLSLQYGLRLLLLVPEER